MDQSRLQSRLSAPQDQSFVVVGAGRTGVAAARLLTSLGATVVLTDDREEDAIVSSLPSELVENASLTIAGGQISILDDDSIIVLSPGVPRARPELQAAIESGRSIVHEIEVALGVLGVFRGDHKAAVAAITGTNGKSTTTSMLGAIVCEQDAKTFVGGNLGRPLCEAVVEGERPSTLVLELSSYQLETITLLPVKAAVVTNLSPDHLDRYESEADYYAAKANLFSLVTPRGGIALNQADPRTQSVLVKSAGDKERLDFCVDDNGPGVAVDGQRLVVRMDGAAEQSVVVDNPRVVGPHNYANAAAAVAAAALLGVPPSAWQRGLTAYEGIAHRMEIVHADNSSGLTFVNDSKATNVDAAAVAIRSFDAGIHLIVGGVGKGSAYGPMVDASRGRVRSVYTIGEDAETLRGAFEPAFVVEDCKTLSAAFASATGAAKPGDVILLSPACASFDQFPNYVARGQAFLTLVESFLAQNTSVRDFDDSRNQASDRSQAGADSRAEGA